MASFRKLALFPLFLIVLGSCAGPNESSKPSHDPEPNGTLDDKISVPVTYNNCQPKKNSEAPPAIEFNIPEKADFLVQPFFSKLASANGMTLELHSSLKQIIEATYGYFELAPNWDPGNLYLPGKGEFPWITKVPSLESAEWKKNNDQITYQGAYTRVILASGNVDLTSEKSIRNCLIIASGKITLPETSFCTLISGDTIHAKAFVSTIVVARNGITGVIRSDEGDPRRWAKGAYLSADNNVSVDNETKRDRFTIQKYPTPFDRISTFYGIPQSARHSAKEVSELRQKLYKIESNGSGKDYTWYYFERYPNDLWISFHQTTVANYRDDFYEVRFPDGSILEISGSENRMVIKTSSKEIIGRLELGKDRPLFYEANEAFWSKLSGDIPRFEAYTFLKCNLAISKQENTVLLSGKCNNDGNVSFSASLPNTKVYLEYLKQQASYKRFLEFIQRRKDITGCSGVPDGYLEILTKGIDLAERDKWVEKTLEPITQAPGYIAYSNTWGYVWEGPAKLWKDNISSFLSTLYYLEKHLLSGTLVGSTSLFKVDFVGASFIVSLSPEYLYQIDLHGNYWSDDRIGSYPARNFVLMYPSMKRWLSLKDQAKIEQRIGYVLASEEGKLKEIDYLREVQSRHGFKYNLTGYLEDGPYHPCDDFFHNKTGFLFEMYLHQQVYRDEFLSGLRYWKTGFTKLFLFEDKDSFRFLEAKTDSVRGIALAVRNEEKFPDKKEGMLEFWQLYLDELLHLGLIGSGSNINSITSIKK